VRARWGRGGKFTKNWGKIKKILKKNWKKKLKKKLKTFRRKIKVIKYA
jgi:hypothetical protein